MNINVKDSNNYLCPMSASGDGYCIGNRCMGWRWKPEENPDWTPKAFSLTEDGTDYRKEPQPYIESKTHGYCGMAVRPSILEGI